MRVRRAVVVVLLLSGGALANPVQAHAAGALSCTNLPGTFSDVFAPTYAAEEIPGSDLAVHAYGACTYDGRSVNATLDGTGRGAFAGVCGAATWSTSLDPNPPDVRPIEEGRVDVTLTLQDAAGTVTTLTDSWTIETENIEAVAVSTSSGAGVIATRLFAKCSPNNFAYWVVAGGNDNARFTWTQSA